MDMHNFEVHELPTFDEDDFDLIEHKKEATSLTKAKARIKRDRRKLSVGRVIIWISAFALCALLYIMASAVVGLF